MWIWLHSWINGTDRKQDQVAHSPSVQMSSSTGCTVDALLIRWEDQYCSPFLWCRLSFKEYEREKGGNASFIGNWQVSMRLSLVWQHAFLWGINLVADGFTRRKQMIKHETPQVKMRFFFLSIFTCSCHYCRICIRKDYGRVTSFVERDEYWKQCLF